MGRIFTKKKGSPQPDENRCFRCPLPSCQESDTCFLYRTGACSECYIPECNKNNKKCIFFVLPSAKCEKCPLEVCVELGKGCYRRRRSSCLQCKLPICDKTHPECLVKKNSRKRRMRFYKTHAESEKARGCANYKKNSQDLQRKRKQRYKKDPEFRDQQLEYCAKWRTIHHEQKKEINRAWYRKNMVRLKEIKALLDEWKRFDAALKKESFSLPPEMEERYTKICKERERLLKIWWSKKKRDAR